MVAPGRLAVSAAISILLAFLIIFASMYFVSFEKVEAFRGVAYQPTADTSVPPLPVGIDYIYVKKWLVSANESFEVGQPLAIVDVPDTKSISTEPLISSSYILYSLKEGARGRGTWLLVSRIAATDPVRLVKEHSIATPAGGILRMDCLPASTRGDLHVLVDRAVAKFLPVGSTVNVKVAGEHAKILVTVRQVDFNPAFVMNPACNSSVGAWAQGLSFVSFAMPTGNVSAGNGDMVELSVATERKSVLRWISSNVLLRD